jgi:death on curing protein
VKQWKSIDAAVISAVHEAQLSEHGGIVGVRDAGLLDSALMRPQNVSQYETPDAAALAAAYGFGISRNHPYLDGNKRTAFVAVELFLALNGLQLAASDSECVITMLKVAAGEATEIQFADWIRTNIHAV